MTLPVTRCGRSGPLARRDRGGSLTYRHRGHCILGPPSGPGRNRSDRWRQLNLGNRTRQGRLWRPPEEMAVSPSIPSGDEIWLRAAAPEGSLALAATVVGDGIGGRPRQQDRIRREVDAVRPVGGVEDQATLVARARRGDAGDFQWPQLD